MGKSEQFVRVGLQSGKLTFGSAVKLSSKWTYYISPKLFYAYAGVAEEKKRSTKQKLFRPCQELKVLFALN